jgi:DNA-binding CsgD family transcriptional regulator
MVVYQLQLEPGSQQLCLSAGDPVGSFDLLTTLELRVLSMLVSGMAPKEIASSLNISLSTVRMCLSQAKRKSGARTLSELAAMFVGAVGTQGVPPDSPPSVAPHEPRGARRVASPETSGDCDYDDGPIRDRFGLPDFLKRSRLASVYMRRAANAFDELSKLHGAWPSLDLAQVQVAVGLTAVPDFRDHIQRSNGGILPAASELRELELALAGEIQDIYIGRTWPIVPRHSHPPASLDQLRLVSCRLSRCSRMALRQQDVADALGVSPRQVRRHVASASERLGTRTSVELSHQSSPPEAWAQATQGQSAATMIRQALLG